MRHHNTGKTMKILEALNLVRVGMQFCEERILPLVVAYAEPKDDTVVRPPLFGGKQSKKSSNLPRPNVVITSYEVKEVIGAYQAILLLIILAGFAFILTIDLVISFIFDNLSSLIRIQERVQSAIGLILIIIFVVFWVGVFASIKKRMKIWEEFREDELEMQKIEYFVTKVGSKKMAKVLDKIEKIKSAYKEEDENLRTIRKKRSILDVEVMKMFNDMMSEREKEITRKGNIKATVLSVLFWFLGTASAYAFEKTFDFWLFGTTPTFGGTNK